MKFRVPWLPFERITTRLRFPLCLMTTVERARLKFLRENLVKRARTHSAAKLRQLAPLDQSQPQELITLSNAVARVRSGLVQELVEVFDVVEVGARGTRPQNPLHNVDFPT